MTRLILIAMLTVATPTMAAQDCGTRALEALRAVAPHIPESVFRTAPPVFNPCGLDAACLERERQKRLDAASERSAALEAARALMLDVLKACGTP